MEEFVATRFKSFDTSLDHGLHFENLLVVREQLRVHLNQLRHQMAGLVEQINGLLELRDRQRRTSNAALCSSVNYGLSFFRRSACPIVGICELLAKPPPFVNDTGHVPISPRVGIEGGSHGHLP